jgi:hypothetical protein
MELTDPHFEIARSTRSVTVTTVNNMRQCRALRGLRSAAQRSILGLSNLLEVGAAIRIFGAYSCLGFSRAAYLARPLSSRSVARPDALQSL